MYVVSAVNQRILISLNVDDETSPLLAVKGSTQRNHNNRNVFICFQLISQVRESGLQVLAGSFKKLFCFKWCLLGSNEA